MKLIFKRYCEYCVKEKAVNLVFTELVWRLVWRNAVKYVV